MHSTVRFGVMCEVRRDKIAGDEYQWHEEAGGITGFFYGCKGCGECNEKYIKYGFDE